MPNSLQTYVHYPFIDPFQSFIMGADALAELETPILDEVEVGGLQRTGRQFTFNDLNFEGFQQQGGSRREQSPFQSFPQFTSPASATPSLGGRARQPIPSRFCEPSYNNQFIKQREEKMMIENCPECKPLLRPFKVHHHQGAVESVLPMPIPGLHTHCQKKAIILPSDLVKKQ